MNRSRLARTTPAHTISRTCPGVASPRAAGSRKRRASGCGGWLKEVIVRHSNTSGLDTRKSAMISTVEHALRMTGTLDPRDGWTADRCTLARALEVIPTRSAFLILREAFYGTTRFDDFCDR